jgi:hypothetical protein
MPVRPFSAKETRKLVTITRRLVHHLRAVMRRTFGTRGIGPAVCLLTGPDGLRARARSIDAAVEYHAPELAGTSETLWLPFDFLADCEGKKDDPVHIERTGKGRATAQWRDGSVPQIVQYTIDKPAHAEEFPSPPANFVENPARLLSALVDAADTTDPDSIRYPLGYVQAGPDGSMAATDGRQLLVQSGFTFPWTEAVLIPRLKVFGSPELPQDQPVLVGKMGDWVVLRVGAWTFYLGINKDGRFPDVCRHIPSAAAAQAHCLFSAADAQFLAETLPKLPSHQDDYNHPVTLDLNGQVVVRARGADDARATEVVLTGSSCTGEPLRVNINRSYLARAMRLGLRELSITDNKSPILGSDAQRHYVVMPLNPEGAIKPADEAIRIESPVAGTSDPIPHPQPRRRIPPVTETSTNANGNGHTPTNAATSPNGPAKANGRAKPNGETRRTKASQQDIAALIEQAETLRTALRDTLLKTNELVKGLKRHRRQGRVIQNTLASLRQLKTLGV